MMAACYTLDLYCDNEADAGNVHRWNEFPHQFTDELGSECRKEARKKGWLIKRNGDVICPKCVKLGLTSKTQKVK